MDTLKVILIVVLAIVIISQFVQMKINMEQNKKLRSIVNQNNKQYQEVYKMNESLRSIRHDINKQKVVLDNVKNTPIVEVITGVDILDRIIHMKREEILDKNIGFSMETKAIPGINLSNGELISVVSNIFDNAIEACESLKEPSINCKIYPDDNYSLNFIVENSKQKGERLNINELETTKDDKDIHGYGVRIIKEIVARHGGNVILQDRGETFYLCVQI